MNRAFIFFLVFFCIASQLYAQTKPNVIYIYADDLGYGELGCYGQTKIKTPNIDRLAAEGIRFTQHYTGAPVCAPARCMLMTGVHAGHSYIRGNYELGGFQDSTERGQMPLPEGTFTIAKMMQQAGYVTGMIGKWGLGMYNNSGNPIAQGFDYYYGYLDQKQAHNYYPTHLWENGVWDTLNNPMIDVHRPITKNAPDSAFNYYKGKEYSLDKMGEKAVSFIKKNKNKPFFLYLPFTAPHLSLQAPDSEIAKYYGIFEEQPYYGERGYAPNKYPKSTYAALISILDEKIGMIMQLLKQLNLDKNTLVMFSSDNGATFNVGGANTNYFNSNAALRGNKQDLYEGGIREPFIARWPGKISAGKTTDHISAQFDLMATLAELTNTKVPTNDGISFLPVLLGKDKKQQQHKYLYFEFPEKGGQVAIRMGPWKAVKSNIIKNPSAPWELYDLSKDQKEQKNVSLEHPDLIKYFEAILQKEHKTAVVKEWEFVK
jgi:arylsulfatase A-like enzyme